MNLECIFNGFISEQIQFWNGVIVPRWYGRRDGVAKEAHNAIDKTTIYSISNKKGEYFGVNWNILAHTTISSSFLFEQCTFIASLERIHLSHQHYKWDMPRIMWRYHFVAFSLELYTKWASAYRVQYHLSVPLSCIVIHIGNIGQSAYRRHICLFRYDWTTWIGELDTHTDTYAYVSALIQNTLKRKMS